MARAIALLQIKARQLESQRWTTSQETALQAERQDRNAADIASLTGASTVQQAQSD